MKKYSLLFTVLLVIVVFASSSVQKAHADGTVNLMVVVNNGLTISDASDTANPTLNVSINVTPDLGASAATGSANLRVRSNYAMWSLTAQQTMAFDASTTSLAATDIRYAVTKTAGSNASATAGTVQSPFSGTSATLNDVGSGSATQIVAGSTKTSTARDSSNTNNYFQVNNTFSVNQDFFFTPGTATCTLTYVLSAI